MDERVRLLVESVREDPDARAALLAALVSAELVDVPRRLDGVKGTLERLADAQARSEANIDRLAGRVDTLAEGLATLTQRVDALTERIDGLAERVDALVAGMGALTDRMDSLADAQRRTEIAVQTLSDRFGKQLPRIDTAIGDVIERRYEERASAYFAPIARRIRVLDRAARDELVDDALEAGRLSPFDAQALRMVDTIAHARRGQETVHLVVEASYTVDSRDVERAVDRAALLAGLVGTALPVVAGEYIDEDARRAATASGAYQVMDGTVTGPDGAVLT